MLLANSSSSNTGTPVDIRRRVEDLSAAARGLPGGLEAIGDFVDRAGQVARENAGVPHGHLDHPSKDLQEDTLWPTTQWFTVQWVQTMRLNPICLMLLEMDRVLRHRLMQALGPMLTPALRVDFSLQHEPTI